MFADDQHSVSGSDSLTGFISVIVETKFRWQLLLLIRYREVRPMLMFLFPGESVAMREMREEPGLVVGRVRQWAV